jgi:hypothetical protein
MPSSVPPVPITQDRGILKTLVEPGDPCKPFPEYDRPSTIAIFHYKIYSLPFKDKTDPNDIFKSGSLALAKLSDSDNESSSSSDTEHDHSHTCSHHNHNKGKTEVHHPENIDTSKRVKIGDSRRWDRQPFELKLNRGFSVQAFELAIKTMRIGETSKFFCLSQYAEVFFILSLLIYLYISFSYHNIHMCVLCVAVYSVGSDIEASEGAVKS